MPGIKDAMKDVLAKLATQQVTNNDNTLADPYIRVWNNQLKYNENGQMEDFPKPAFFLEVVSPVRFEVIGQGYADADVNWKIHIVHEYYNDADGGTYEQDLLVFDIRDSIIALLTYFTPAGCGPMTRLSEEQDTEHKNIYHYVIDFISNFTDSKGSRLDEGRNYYITKAPPTALEVDATVDNSQPIINQQQFVIPKR